MDKTKTVKALLLPLLLFHYPPWQHLSAAYKSETSTVDGGSTKLFNTSKNADRTDSWEQDVFYLKGPSAGEIKYQTVAGNLLCEGKIYVL